MKICGLQKTTLLDYPGHIAATIFLGGCNFCCPFCHNSDFVKGQIQQQLSTEEVIYFLKKRASILEGVCISGGEPTTSPDLEQLIRAVKKLGYLVKLDTNGYRPDVLKYLVRKNLLDYISMDIKSCRERYPVTAGISGIDTSLIEESAHFLIHGSVPYEFRTTAVKELHNKEDFFKIGLWLGKCSQYFIQNYVASSQVMCPGFTSCSKEELMSYANILRNFMGRVSLRGVDY